MERSPFRPGEGTVLAAGYEATNASSASAYSAREEGTRVIEVRDVSPGTVCYFYLVGDAAETPFGSFFIIEIEELSY